MLVESEFPHTKASASESVSIAATDLVLQENVCRRIDDVIERVQAYIHRLPWDPPYDGPYTSFDDLWSDVTQTLKEARAAGLEQNHHKRVQLGTWIGMLHVRSGRPGESLLEFDEV